MRKSLAAARLAQTLAREMRSMTHTMPQVSVHAALAALICLSGCGHKPSVYGIAQSGSSWTTSTADPTPGIDEASVTFVTLNAGPPEGVSFVVWSDLPNGSSGSGGGRTGGASYKGHHRATDGRRVEFHASTTDGKAGTITIADVRYDLANGALFLVSTQHTPPEIAQITFDTASFPKGRDHLIELAKSNARIRAFFEKHKKQDRSVQ
jgi:hypothetical protein